MGLWLLIREHLRLGTWDLLRGWAGRDSACLEPRLALQLVHEAALCTTGLRQKRTLSQKGFELANGLPFVATDQAIHQLLGAHSVKEAQGLQVALGQIRRASGHYQGKLVAIDPSMLFIARSNLLGQPDLVGCGLSDSGVRPSPSSASACSSVTPSPSAAVWFAGLVFLVPAMFALRLFIGTGSIVLIGEEDNGG